MILLVAFMITVVLVASPVGGTMLHPMPYGTPIAAVIVAPPCLFTSIGSAIFDALFGRRR